MRNLREKLCRLVPGDIIHGKCPEGPSLICVVESVTFDRIEVRCITLQDKLAFDIETGLTMGNDVLCTLDSIAPVPCDVHDVLLGLDRKMRLSEPPLNRAEIDALIFVGRFYRAHPL